MTIDQPYEVSIRHIGFGVVAIGDEPVAPAGAVTLDIFAATLDFDPARPDRLPSCLIADPDAAALAVAQIYGDAAADEVSNCAKRRDDATTSVPVVAQPGLEIAARLAEVRWCQHNTALPLDPSLLLLEEMVLLNELRDVVELGDDWIERLHWLLGALMSRPQAVRSVLRQPTVKTLVTDALDALASGADVLGEERSAALTWLGVIGRGEPQSAEEGPAEEDRGVDWLAHLHPELALAAGASLTQGTSTVQWRDIPLGFLTRREDNVSWRAELRPARATVTATVETADSAFLLGEPSLPGGMYFDVFSKGWPAPLATGEMTRDADAHRWSGAVELGDAQTRLLGEGSGLDVRVRGAVPEPMEDPRAAEAERWCARAVSALRLRGVADARDLLDSADSSLERAENLWMLAGRRAELDATRELRERARDVSMVWAHDLTVAEMTLLERS